MPQASRVLSVRSRVGRTALRLDDEYDLQDLTEFTLRLLYRDVRPEEWTPSYGRSSSRIDFLIKEARAANEVKVTYAGRADKQIGNEIILDQAHYRAHPDVDHLVAVVYDLAGTFKNAPGFEHDLSAPSDQLSCRVVVVPWPADHLPPPPVPPR
jgi:hypothetical protein